MEQIKISWNIKTGDNSFTGTAVCKDFKEVQTLFKNLEATCKIIEVEEPPF